MARRLGEALIEAGLVSETQLRRALDYQDEIGGRLGRIIVKLGLVDEDVLVKFISEQQDIAVADLHDFKPDEELMELLPRETIENHLVIPLEKTDDKIIVALTDIGDDSTLEPLRESGLDVEIRLAPPMRAQAVINDYYYHTGVAGEARVKNKAENKEKVSELKRRIASQRYRELLEEIDNRKVDSEILLEAVALVLARKNVVSVDEMTEAATCIKAARAEKEE